MYLIPVVSGTTRGRYVPPHARPSGGQQRGGHSDAPPDFNRGAGYGKCLYI